MRDEHHHPVEQHDGAGIDAGDGLVERQPADDDHQDGANDRGTRAIHAEHGDAAERNHRVGAGEDEGGNHARRCQVA